MKKFSFKIGILVVTLLVWSSCMDLDSDIYPNEFNENINAKFSAWGFVKVTGDDFYVETDSGKLLKAEQKSSIFQVKEGTRVFLRFDIPAENSSNSYDALKSNAYTYVVKIGVLIAVDFDKIMNVGINSDEIYPEKSGYVKLNGMGISSHYLNLEASFNPTGYGKHVFKLVYDETHQVANSPIVLELIDTSSSEKEPFEHLSKKLLSFDINSLGLRPTNSEGKILFALVVNRGTEWEKKYNLVYEP